MDLYFDPSPSPNTLLLLPFSISVSGIGSWVRKLAQKVLATRKSGTLLLVANSGVVVESIRPAPNLVRAPVC